MPRPAAPGALVGLVALVAVAIAGCGENVSASRMRYQQQADAVCSGLRASARTLAPPRTAADTASYVQRTVAISEDAVRRLRALHPPSGMAAAHLRLADAIAARNGAVQSVLASIAGGTAQPLALEGAAPRLRSLTDTILTQAEQLGLTGCG
jgi:hypothetical protein